MKKRCITTWHSHFELSWLLARSDSELSVMLRNGTPVELRTQLVIMKASGKTALVVNECDNRNADGTCAGHPSAAD